MKNIQELNLFPFSELLEHYGKRYVLKSHQTIINVGDQCDKVYYILKGGLLRRFYNPHSDDFKTISFHLPDYRSVVTINKSFFSNTPSNYELKAFKTSELIIIKNSDLESINAQNEELQNFYNQQIINSLILENELKSRLISFNSIEFYNYICQEYPEIIKSVPSKYIAEFMGISAEWLSKLKKERSSS